LSPKTPKNTSFLGVTQPPGGRTAPMFICPSLIEMGSKTAEKNSAQTNRQTDKLTDENDGHLAVNQKEGREREGREEEKRGEQEQQQQQQQPGI